MTAGRIVRRPGPQRSPVAAETHPDRDHAPSETGFKRDRAEKWDSHGRRQQPFGDGEDLSKRRTRRIESQRGRHAGGGGVPTLDTTDPDPPWLGSNQPREAADHDQPIPGIRNSQRGV